MNINNVKNDCECKNILINPNDPDIDKIRFVRDNCKENVKKCFENNFHALNTYFICDTGDNCKESFLDLLIPEFMRQQ